MLQKLTVFATAISLFAYMQSATAQSFGENSGYKTTEEIYVHQYNAIPNFVKFQSDQLPDVSNLKSLFQKYWGEGSAFDFVQIGKEVDQLGFEHLRYRQTYRGIPIALTEIILHTKQGKIFSFNGKLIQKSPKTLEASLSEDEALSFALNFVGASAYKWQLEEEEMHLKFESKDSNASYYPYAELQYIAASLDEAYTESQLRLCYKFNIYAHEPLSRQEVYVDAANGDIVFKNDLIHTGNVKGTAHTGYSGIQSIYTDSVSSTQYRLRQTIHGNGINTYNMSRGVVYANASDFTDSDNTWNNVNASLDEYATDAQWGAEMTYVYLDSMFGRNSINNNGFALNSYIHYANNFANAFWDGFRMTYGDGNSFLDPFQTLDIAAHEIAHGLTSNTANLIYQAESGALNESFSDIFGTAIEFFARPNRANWTVGEDIGSTFRSMSNPKRFRDPDTYRRTNYVSTDGCVPSGQNDNCGVHTNSGVQNFWFYLLSQGGSGTNDRGNAYTVDGVGIDTAAAIAYRNLVVYLNVFSEFQDARTYSIISAIDLYGPCSKAVESVTNAWYAVGVGGAYVPGVQSAFNSSNTEDCQAPLVVSFINESNNAVSFHWDFGDGNTDSVRNPIHTYDTTGKYTVRLIADGGTCGIDTIEVVDYVDIDSSNACVYYLDNGNNGTVSDCEGKLFDSGGALNTYGSFETSTITISPFGASSITLDFLSFNLESGQGGVCNFDHLEIFDGPTSASPSMGRFCGTSSPGLITSTRGQVTIVLTSDGQLERSGFEMNWKCNPPTGIPVANFEISTDTTCEGEVQFKDFSSEAPTSWSWNFGDGNTSNLENPTHIYTSNGDFNVTLIATNQFGSDTIQKNAVVHVNRPVGPSTTNDTICASQSATLTATGSGQLRWYDQEVGGNFIKNGSNLNLSSLSNDTSFWVEDFIKAPVQTVGPVTNTIGTGANFTSNHYLEFDVYEKIQLLSVRVFSGTSGNRTIELRDSNRNVLQSITKFVSTGTFRVNLDFVIEPGTSYQLGVSQSTTPNFYRNDGGVSFPYTINNKISITNSSATSNPLGFYYFFYNWRVKGFDCLSPRVKASAVIDPQCGITGVDEIEDQGEINLYPNPASNKLFIENSSDRMIQSIRAMSISGQEVMYIENPSNIVANGIDISALNSGVYFIQMQLENELKVQKIIVNH